MVSPDPTRLEPGHARIDSDPGAGRGHVPTQRVLVLCHDLSDNALSRAQVLWRLARANGWEAMVAGPQTRSLWPGATGEFAAACVRLPSGVVAMTRACSELTEWSTCVIACKTYPTSLGIARVVARRKRRPLIVDIDDFDAEHYLSRGWRGFARVLAKSSPRRLVRDLTGMHNPIVARNQRRSVQRFPVTASSPALRSEYGGTFLPAARDAFAEVAQHTSDRPVVGFLGTVRPHKGVETLRKAIEALAPQGFSLVVTAHEPEDAMPWETWTGPVTYERIRQLLTTVDVVAVPSSASGSTSAFASGQLSIKLLDAMAAGRACVVGNLEPLRWGLSGTGVVVDGDSAEDLAAALQPLRDPALRASMGQAARRRADESFSMEAMTPVFASIVLTATSAYSNA